MRGKHGGAHFIAWHDVERLQALVSVPTLPLRKEIRFRRERIPVDEARAAYDRLGTWRAVAEEVTRKDGSKFQPKSIHRAVRWADKGYAGRVIG